MWYFKCQRKARRKVTAKGSQLNQWLNWSTACKGIRWKNVQILTLGVLTKRIHVLVIHWDQTQHELLMQESKSLTLAPNTHLSHAEIVQPFSSTPFNVNLVTGANTLSCNPMPRGLVVVSVLPCAARIENASRVSELAKHSNSTSI